MTQDSRPRTSGVGCNRTTIGSRSRAAARRKTTGAHSPRRARSAKITACGVSPPYSAHRPPSCNYLKRLDNYISEIANQPCSSADAQAPNNQRGPIVSTIESRKTDWLIASEDRDHLSSRVQPGGLRTMSVRAMFDLATLITAGAASTVFLLLPAWSSLGRLATEPAVDSPSVVVLAAGPRIDPTNATLSELATIGAHSITAPRHRPMARTARAPRPTPTSVRTRPEAKPQSKLARLLLGDGREPVQPFPLPARRSQR